ncbi:hypothetical protein C0993_003311 [Termitomyces sp. T159_Od127]|nr:hypothetical protein C0993_003311 [Termitomyces sp. T159_Od127]
MEQNCNPQFVVRCVLLAGYRTGPGLASNVPVLREAQNGPGVGQAGLKVMQDVAPRVGPPKVAFGSSDAGDQPDGGSPQCYDCGCMGHYAKDCKVLKAHLQAAHTAAAESNSESDGIKELEELIEYKETL